ncbi:MAG: glycosyltransferase [Pyrinomonadaceae bacterium]|nr:glycosyltransferase [Pyrinomonadaceae bacterium]
MSFAWSASTVLIGIAWTTLLLWLVAALLTWRGLHRRPLLLLALPSDDELKGDDAPLVSILVPARNEERRVLAAAVRSMLAQDYERLEFVAVDDRSIDATGAILKSLAAIDPRLRVLDGVEPPDGWLGKPHAMWQALANSRGEWVLATDADMIFEPQLVRAAVSRARAGGFDALTLIPRVECLTFWERVFMPTFGWFVSMSRPVERVNDPRRPESIGIGGFFLMRRARLEAVGGYEAVAGEVAEDLRLAELLKKSGARLRVEHAPQLLRTRMQPNLRGIWEGFTKNLFAGAKFSAVRGIAGLLGLLLFHIAPLPVALWCGLMWWATGTTTGGMWWPHLLVPCALIWLTQVLTFMLINRGAGVPLRYALTVPLGIALFAAILLNSMLKILSGQGVMWKGRKLYARGSGAVARMKNE